MDLTGLITGVKAFGYGNEDDDVITSFINMSYQDVVGRHRWRFNESTAIVTTTSGVATNAVPTSLYLGALRSLTDGVPNPVFVDNKSEIDDAHLYPQNVNRTSTPRLYTIVGSLIYWYPVPNAAITYRLYIWTAPTLLSNGSDTPIIPANFHQVLIEGALMHIASRDHNPSRMQEHERRYEELIQQMRMKDQVRTTNSTHMYLPKRYGGLYDHDRNT